MALDLNTIRTALDTRITAAINASSRPANIYAYPPDSPELPAIMIRPRTGTATYVQFHKSFSNTTQGDNALVGIELEIEVRVGGWDIDAQIAMDAYLGTATTASIINAIESDKTLGGVVESCWVRAVNAPSRYLPEDGVREYLAAKFEFEAFGRR